MDPREESLIQDLFDGRLEGPEAEAVRARLDADPECRELWDDLARIRDLLRPATGEGRAPPDFLSRVRERIAGEGPRSTSPEIGSTGDTLELRRSRSRWRPLALAAAALLVAALGMSFFPTADGPPEQTVDVADSRADRILEVEGDLDRLEMRAPAAPRPEALKESGARRGTVAERDAKEPDVPSGATRARRAGERFSPPPAPSPEPADSSTPAMACEVADEVRPNRSLAKRPPELPPDRVLRLSARDLDEGRAQLSLLILSAREDVAVEARISAGGGAGAPMKAPWSGRMKAENGKRKTLRPAGVPQVLGAIRLDLAADEVERLIAMLTSRAELADRLVVSGAQGAPSSPSGPEASESKVRDADKGRPVRLKVLILGAPSVAPQTPHPAAAPASRR